ncbi:MAG: hypothetical protein H6742_14110 [Alphaproteobacteria bacterium]|nr:hypothetical protein [Alphaproteobacteria bacterium]
MLLPLWIGVSSILAAPDRVHDHEHTQRALEPRGAWSGGIAPVPAAPHDCKPIVRVQVPWALCEDPALVPLAPNPDGAEGTGTRSYDGHDDHAAPIACGLTCSDAWTIDDGEGDPVVQPATASWFFRIDAVGLTGPVTCTLADGASQTIDLQPLDGPVPVGIGAYWLTDVSTLHASTPMGPDAPVRLHGDNLCPDGQPTREGRVVDALKRLR